MSKHKPTAKLIGEFIAAVVQLGCFVVLAWWGWMRYSGTDLLAFAAGLVLLRDAAGARFKVSS